ncbi:amidohydrolase family protein [Solibaculum mannosilyticum]|uniref:Amidohydrolase n=1 Tax=Solibaculum mannosilyticum TaxID=2780922 RepID=A0A7I8D2F0_9FIRM|nr:amidohydrolase family protein [Solibaculum mannosilyticum]MCO7137611.1 amidohydrolase family protein [[Clostridium] leptum]BCI59413.1 amidohydrolase [Solibaculum mannosilyticum]CZT56139.1 Amidohydrolase [Eubacteriaceae bacterium CHKCI005]
MQDIIDFHAHIFPEKIADKATTNIGAFYDIPMHVNGRVTALLEEGEKAGIHRFVVQSVATKPDQVHSINCFIAQQCEQHPELIGLGTLHPLMEDWEEEIKHIQELGLRGVKLHPDFQRFQLDDPMVFPIYAKLEGKLPLLVHTGDPRYDFSHPRRMARVLDKFPALDVVAAHLGGWMQWKESEQWLLPRRVWVDTSSSYAFMEPEEYRRLIRAFGPDRCLFGTDFPMWQHEPSLRHLRGVGLEEEELGKVLSGNAKKVLGLPE